MALWTSGGQSRRVHEWERCTWCWQTCDKSQVCMNIRPGKHNQQPSYLTMTFQWHRTSIQLSKVKEKGIGWDFCTAVLVIGLSCWVGWLASREGTNSRDIWNKVGNLSRISYPEPIKFQKAYWETATKSEKKPSNDQRHKAIPKVTVIFTYILPAFPSCAL